jgi:DNA polymerase elongation subunit (family B)
LKDIARHFGLASPDRTYVDGSRISRIWDEDPARIEAYAMDDVRETEGISRLLGASYFVQAQIFPLTFQNVVVRGNASRIDLLFLREYLRLGLALPQGGLARGFEGGYTGLRREGVMHNVLHCDVRSLYPSIMLSYGIQPRQDSEGVFLSMLRDLRQFRLEAKDAARRAGSDRERDTADALQSTFKILINSFYGYLGFANGHFADFDAAERVTSTGRQLILQMEAWLESEGAKVIEIDTDGIYFLPPAGITTPEAAHGLIERLNDTLPEGIEAELDGRYQGMFSYKIKNYALLGYDGRLIIRGSGLRSRAVERFQRVFMEQLFQFLLRGEVDRVAPLYHTFQDALKQHRWPVAMFSKRENLTESLEAYRERVASKQRSAAASYEVALRTGRPYLVGDPVVYYVTGKTRKVKVHEAARAASAWNPAAPDENVPYYLAKLEEVYARFEAHIVAAGGPSLAEVSAAETGILELPLQLAVSSSEEGEVE